MALFGFGKKKEKKSECKSNCIDTSKNKKDYGGIKILGGGCVKCHELEANTKVALNELGVKEDVELITDFALIAAYGVMSTPALVIDGKVVAYGKILKKDEIIKLYKDVRG